MLHAPAVEQLGIQRSARVADGIVILGCVPGSPASSAGFRYGDVLLFGSAEPGVGGGASVALRRGERVLRVELDALPLSAVQLAGS